MIGKTLKREIVYKGRVIRVGRQKVRLPGGRTTTLDVVNHPGASAVVPILDNGKFVLIRQYRHAAGGYIYEIPAGILEKGERPLECAKRELAEETGYRAKRWKRLTKIFTSPGFADEVIHIFLAKGLTPAKMRLDYDEVIDVRLFTKTQVKKLIRSGRISDSKSLVGLFFALTG